MTVAIFTLLSNDFFSSRFLETEAWASSPGMEGWTLGIHPAFKPDPHIQPYSEYISCVKGGSSPIFG